MPGRPKKKVYQYDQEGRFLKTYDCENDVRKEYYFTDKGKRPLFRNSTKYVKTEYHILPDNTLLFKERVGRVGVIEFNKRLNNEFIKVVRNSKPVKVMNLDNKEIARFSDINIAAKMTNIPLGTIHHCLYDGKQKFSHRGLIFKH